MPDDTLDFDRDDPSDAEHGPAEPCPAELDPRLQEMFDNALHLLRESERGSAERAPAQSSYPAQLYYASESGLKNIMDALASAKSLGPDIESEQTKALPTIWYHGERSYSADGGMPTLVSDEQDNILQCFLDRDIAFDTDALTNKSGTVNVAAAISRIVEKFGDSAIRRPKKKGDGYFIRVRTSKPIR